MMDKRFAMTIAAGTVLALPLLTACGTGTAPEASPAASTSSQAAPATSPSASTAEPTPSATPSTDPAQEKKDVQAATEKFTKVVLTIGYPDKDVDDYLDRIEPLMTKDAFRAAKGTKTIKDAPKELKTLYTQRARIVPDLDGSPEVSSLTADSANAKVSFRVKTQQQRDGDWKTLETSSKDSSSVKLTLEDGKWLVSDAG